MCASSHHVNVTNHEWVFLGGREAKRISRPRVTKAGGQLTGLVEEFTHCGRSQQKQVSRNTVVHVMYEKPSFWSPFFKKQHVETFGGNEAFCLQHMADIFLNKHPCT